MVHAAILKVHVVVVGRLLCRPALAVQQRLSPVGGAHRRRRHGQRGHRVALAAGAQGNGLVMRQNVGHRVRRGPVGGGHAAQLMRLPRLRWRGAAAGDGLHAVRRCRTVRLVDGIVEMGVGVRMMGAGRHRGCRVLVMIVMLVRGVCVLNGIDVGRIGAARAASAAAVAAHADGCAAGASAASSMVMPYAAQLVAQYARDGADAGHVRLVADALAEQAIAYLPGEDARIPLLQLAYVVDHLGRGDARLGAANGTRQYGAGLVVARQYLRNAAVTHAQLARDVAGSDAQPGELHNAHSRRIRQRPAVHKDAAQLIHFAVLRALRL